MRTTPALRIAMAVAAASFPFAVAQPENLTPVNPTTAPKPLDLPKAPIRSDSATDPLREAVGGIPGVSDTSKTGRLMKASTAEDEEHIQKLVNTLFEDQQAFKISADILAKAMIARDGQGDAEEIALLKTTQLEARVLTEIVRRRDIVFSVFNLLPQVAMDISALSSGELKAKSQKRFSILIRMLCTRLKKDLDDAAAPITDDLEQLVKDTEKGYVKAADAISEALTANEGKEKESVEQALTKQRDVLNTLKKRDKEAFDRLKSLNESLKNGLPEEVRKQLDQLTRIALAGQATAEVAENSAKIGNSEMVRQLLEQSKMDLDKMLSQTGEMYRTLFSDPRIP